MKATALCVGVLAIVYSAFAYVFAWWPFVFADPPRASGCIAYHVAVDISGSNTSRGNWPGEAKIFADHLQFCDTVSFWVIDGKTTQNEQPAPHITMPWIDAAAPSQDRGRVTAELKRGRTRVQQQLRELMLRTSKDQKTDILGLFRRLQIDQATDTKQVLVIFSDGQESLIDKMNLEKCLTGGHKRDVEETVRSLQPIAGLGAITEVIWVVPNLAGKPQCNSLVELKTVWAAALAKFWDPARAPRLIFETNPFASRVGHEN